ncbi:MAG: JAB domain-containing protein [Clostridium sp.]|nr:JAB domain-containing protein [Clostridium sp.]
MKASKRVNIVSIQLVRESSVLYSNRKIESPNEGVELVRKYLENFDREKLIVVGLDNRNQPTFIDTISIGTINSSLVHPREVFKSAILSNSASIIMFHNHPSGETEASKEDINITYRIKEAGKIIGINLIDHIIIGSNGRFSSLKEKGVI